MSEKKERKVEEIQNEYSSLCVKAGHLQYQVAILSEDLRTLNAQLKELNLEGAAAVARAKEQEASKEAEGAKNE